MRLFIDRALFESQSQAEAMGLIDLLGTVARDADAHPHAVLTNPLYQKGSDNGPTDAWLASRSPWERDAFQGLLDSGPVLHRNRALMEPSSDNQEPRRWKLEGSLTIRVERRSTSDWKNRRLTITDAADLLREPVHLVLENARTDLTFIRLLAGPTNTSVLQALAAQPGRITVHGGGAGESKKWLEALADAAPAPAIRRQLLRTWVLFDKDAGDADACSVSRVALDLMKLCERIVSTHGDGLSWICLLRREIESYVPDSALRSEALEAQTAFVHKIISWRVTQQPWAWALDLKKGLRGDLRADLPERERRDLKDRKIPLEAHMLKAPFSRLHPGDVGTLDSGLGDRLGEAFRAESLRAWAADLPAEYDRGPEDQTPRRSFVQSLFDRM